MKYLTRSLSSSSILSQAALIFSWGTDAAGQLVHLADAVDFIAEPLDTEYKVAALGRENFQRVAADAEIGAFQGHVIAGILNGHQLLQYLVAVLFHAGAEGDRHSLKFVGTAQAVNAGDRCDDNNVPALRQGSCRGQAQLIDLVIDHRVLGDIGVALGNIGLGLVIIVIGHKIFHCVLREKFLHLAVELACQCLVVGNDQRGLVQCLDDIGHGKGFARTCYAQQGLKLISLFEAPDQVLDRPGLVSGRRIFRMEHKMIHSILS